MPKKKTRKAGDASSMQYDTSSQTRFSDDSESTSTSFKELDQSSWHELMEEKTKEFLATLDRMKEETLARADVNFNTQLLLLPKSVRETAVEFSDKGLKELLECNVDEYEKESSHENIPPQTIRTARRSRSAGGFQSKEHSDKIGGLRNARRRRSISLDKYKTPMNKVPLSKLAAAEKYTVLKPKRVEDSGISLKRQMKPNEEALSVGGSPLHVHSNISKPTVSIPLPGGVVMNIQPKRPKGPITVPELDSEIKEQIRMLNEQLKIML